MPQTYYAAKDIKIQTRSFAHGEVIGTGDVEKGEFTAAKGCEQFVELGHVIPRLNDGRIVTEQPAPDAPSTPKPKPGRKPKPENN